MTEKITIYQQEQETEFETEKRTLFCWRLEKIKKCFILKSNGQIICDQRKKKGKKHIN